MRILHVFRAPVGGLFRHVSDLVTRQVELGHEVGVICAKAEENSRAADELDRLDGICELGLKQLPMSRLPGLNDAMTTREISEFCQRTHPQIIHGHGAKGGVYARLAASTNGSKVIYTPHGGTLHFSRKSPMGFLYLSVEKMLLARTSGLVFVCDYEKRTFDEKIGIGAIPSTIVHNGLWPYEIAAVKPLREASDIVFVGELRDLKGVDVLLKAIAGLPGTSATIVGDGPHADQFKTLATSLNLDDRVTFTGAMPARTAFAQGRAMVVPSRNESFPYIVLEAIAAHKPLIASNVGGISEILDEAALVPADDVQVLTTKIAQVLGNLDHEIKLAATRANSLKQGHSVDCMTKKICDFYSQCLDKTVTRTNAA